MPPAVLAIAAFWGALRVLLRLRQLENVATSTIHSAAQGYVELHGSAEGAPGAAPLSPLSRQPCFGWSYRISRHNDDALKSGWRVEWEQKYDGPFVVRDSSGRCVIDPAGAERIGQLLLGGGEPYVGTGDEARPLQPVMTKGSRLTARSEGRYRYEEWVLPPGLPLYVLGEFRTERSDRRPEVFNSKLPADWAEEIRRDGLHTMSRPADGRPMLLSTQSQQSLRDGSSMLIAALLIGGLFCAILAIWMIGAALAGRETAQIMAGLFGSLLGALALLLGGGPLAAAVRVALGHGGASRWRIVPLLLLGIGLGGLCLYAAHWQLLVAGIL